MSESRQSWSEILRTQNRLIMHHSLRRKWALRRGPNRWRSPSASTLWITIITCVYRTSVFTRRIRYPIEAKKKNEILTINRWIDWPNSWVVRQLSPCDPDNSDRDSFFWTFKNNSLIWIFSNITTVIRKQIKWLLLHTDTAHHHDIHSFASLWASRGDCLVKVRSRIRETVTIAGSRFLVSYFHSTIATWKLCHSSHPGVRLSLLNNLVDVFTKCLWILEYRASIVIRWWRLTREEVLRDGSNLE